MALVRHQPWCELKDRVESHAACVAHLGTTVVNDEMQLEVQLSKAQDVPALIAVTVVEGGRRRLVPLNVERAHELVAVLGHGVWLITRSAGQV